MYNQTTLLKDLNRLLMYCNAVTANHRHSIKIEKRDLDRLSNYQIDLEQKYGILKKSDETTDFYGVSYPKICPNCGGKIISKRNVDLLFGDLTTDIAVIFCENVPFKCNIILDILNV